jgi:hypothetical protein
MQVNFGEQEMPQEMPEEVPQEVPQEAEMEMIKAGLQQILASENIDEIKAIAQGLLGVEEPPVEDRDAQFNEQLDTALQ